MALFIVIDIALAAFSIFDKIGFDVMHDAYSHWSYKLFESHHTTFSIITKREFDELH
jgi:hypothetical protein